MQSEILEPIKEYIVLKQKFAENTDEYFEELVKKSGINVDENARTVDAYNKTVKQCDEARKKVSSIKMLKGFTIFFIVAAFIAFAIFVARTVIVIKDSGEGAALALNIPLAVVCLGLAIGLIIVVKKKINKVVAARKQKVTKLSEKAQGLYNEALLQTAPLNALFDWGMTADIVKKTTPIIQLDNNFDVKKMDYLSNKYGFGENYNPKISTCGVVSGSLVGNPFVFERQFVHEMSTKTYTGELLITWTEYETDSNGNTRSVQRSQTLIASVVKPFPEYNYNTYLYYGNEAAPDLSFSRYPSKANSMSEKQIEKFVEESEKKLHKKSEKAILSGKSSFMQMSNSEFDSLFGALDRNNEVQFRLLFTPLAQRNMVDLIKSKVPFGDDFCFIKNNQINTIISEHAQNWDISTNPTKFASHDLRIIKEKFCTFNESYFESIYFDLAPILSIPLYQQNKPHEYIYKDNYPRNCTSYEAETLANSFDDCYFKHPNSATPAILKTSLTEKCGTYDKLIVTANSYEAFNRVDFIPVACRDGNIYDVPVPWVEYLPIYKDTEMQMGSVDETTPSFSKKVTDYFNKAASNVPVSFQRGLFAFIPIVGYEIISGLINSFNYTSALSDVTNMQMAEAAGKVVNSVENAENKFNDMKKTSDAIERQISIETETVGAEDAQALNVNGVVNEEETVDSVVESDKNSETADSSENQKND